MLEAISTKGSPAAVGPYSQGIRLGSTLFTSGIVPIDPKTGEVVEGDIVEQTHRVMQSLQAVLEEGQASFDSVVKTTCYIKDMDHFAGFNSAYEQYFENNKPSRSCIAVRELPKGVLCKVDAIALTN